MAKLGRPSKYKEEYAEQARKLCLLGATLPELAAFFEVNTDTISEWKSVHVAFSDAIKEGKEQADANVAARLYNRALGYEHEDVDIRVLNGEIVQTKVQKYYPPDTAAAIFWLKNRQRAKWRDRIDQELSGPDGAPIQTESKLNVSGLSTEALAEIMALQDAAKRK
jgi:hypothetical protein